jgi:hypothetical protein
VGRKIIINRTIERKGIELLMSIIIQSITVAWNKDYRGGKEAEIRNAVPDSYPLPLEACVHSDSNNIIIHEVKRYHHNDFQISDNVQCINASNHKVKGGYLKIGEEYLEVYFKYSYYDCGKPFLNKYDETGTLIPLEEKAFILLDDEYGKVVFNGKYTDIDNGNWWYEKKVHNIIRTSKIHKDVFLRNEVIKSYKKLSILQ